MDAGYRPWMVVQAHAGTKEALEKIPDRNIPVLLAGYKGKNQESF